MSEHDPAVHAHVSSPAFCPSGGTDMWLRRDGRITCHSCEKDTGQLWIWENANDG